MCSTQHATILTKLPANSACTQHATILTKLPANSACSEYMVKQSGMRSFKMISLDIYIIFSH